MPMVLLEEHDRYGRPIGYPELLCEPHARERAAGLGARWPEPHEHAASTWDKARRYKTTIEVLRREATERTDRCEVCYQPTAAELLEAQGRT